MIKAFISEAMPFVFLSALIIVLIISCLLNTSEVRRGNDIRESANLLQKEQNKLLKDAITQVNKAIK